MSLFAPILLAASLLPPVNTIDGLLTVPHEDRFQRRPFVITGLVEYVSSDLVRSASYIVSDSTGRIDLPYPETEKPIAGQICVITGTCAIVQTRNGWGPESHPAFIGSAPPPKALELPIADLSPEHHDLRFVVTEGKVLCVTPDRVDSAYGILILEDGGHVLNVFFNRVLFTTLQRFVGARLRVRGIYRRRIHGVRSLSAPFILLENQTSYSVAAPPPWWTPLRLMTAIGLILGALLVLLVWNLALRKLVERRGRELAASQLAEKASALRVEERTRLAVELHDTISQNLSGASMRLDAARRILSTDAAKASTNLELASRTLGACREELRNCIWDLRGQALETKDTDEMIRLAVANNTGDAKLAIRFNVPRETISDNTAHALLSIVRELAVNAVRHGHATLVRIAGAVENGRLLFSVGDNGCGFDPASRPGVPEGHFGLDGIAERIRAFDGRLTVESTPGKGTHITVSLVLPKLERKMP